MTADLLIKNINIASMSTSTGYGIVGEDISGAKSALGSSAIAIKDGLISWVGSSDDAKAIAASKSIDGGGQFLTPGLIDCHTHLVYGGNRAAEFELKLQGATYEEISQGGGGIVSTVNATRALSSSELYTCSSPRLETLLSEGVTSLEIKSGYGLNLEDEIKILEVARMLGDNYPVSVKTSFLGAHALPKEYADKDAYIQFLIDLVLPEIYKRGLADAVDFFCEGIGFSREQCKKICVAAKSYGLPLRGHVEQLSNLHGATLLAEFNGLSVDHLEYLSEEDLPALKAADLAAVLLPGAFYSLGESKLPPINGLREHKIPIAIASDLNPGSSPIASLLCVMNLACVEFKLTPAEVLRGVTRHAAKALGMQDQIGQIKEGFNADIVLWPIESPAQLCYGMNLVKPTLILKDGKGADTL